MIDRASWNRTSIAVVAAALASAVFLALCTVSIVRFLSLPSPGLALFDFPIGGKLVFAVPISVEAAAAFSEASPSLDLIEVNGVAVRELPPGRARVVQAIDLLDLSPGAKNRFVVMDDLGHRTSLELTAAPPSLKASPMFITVLLGSQTLAFVYLVIGLVVWWRRPDDPAAVPLLFFCAVAAVAMAQTLPLGVFEHAMALLRASLLPIYAPAGIWLAIRFTGFVPGPAMKRFGAGVAIASAILAVGIGLTWWRWAIGEGEELPMRTAMAVAGVLLALGIASLLAVCVRALAPSHPPMLRRRAKVLGGAALASFVLPTLSTITVAIVGRFTAWWPLMNMLSLALFPALLGWAIVRHRLFDLRIVLRRGLVFLVLSVIVSLTYAAVVLISLRILGTLAESPIFLGLVFTGAVLLFTLAHVKLQTMVDRRVFRTRYAYADAVKLASESIARAHTIEEAAETARSALIEGMQLDRGYLVIRASSAETSVVCLVLRAPGPNESPLEALPERIELGRHEPIDRALASKAMASVYDPNAEEDPFYARFGIEAIVPLGTSSTGAAPGALVLGPKRDGRLLDSEDLALLFTLANQLAVGIENALALAEIRRLKESLEDQVAERTKELRGALDELRAAQGQLVESAKQAMLGRLVAGIVHEINSPLGAIVSSSDTMKRGLTLSLDRLADEAAASRERVRRALESSLKLAELQITSAQRISDVVSSLKQFVSLDRAELQLFDVRLGIDSTVSVLAAAMSDRITVERAYPEKLSPVSCSPEKLNQVFLHVLQNAIDAIPDRGKIQVSVVEAAGKIEIEIRDSGRGIRPDLLPSLFEFGFVKKNGRMALRVGLPTCKQTVEALGGAFTVASAEGQGTSVFLSLPVARTFS
jgi:signal transduction histidine kinase